MGKSLGSDMIVIPLGPVGASHYRPMFVHAFGLLVIAFSIVGLRSRVFRDECSLDYETVRPMTWITAPLVHDNLALFLLNVMFFWLLGLVLESRFGFGKFAGSVFVVALSHALTSQVFFFWMEAKDVPLQGNMNGLTALNFALIVVALIYAYDRKLSFLLHLIFYWKRFSISIMTIAGVYLAAVAVVLGSTGGPFDLIHFTGFLVGLLFAVFLTMSGIVPEQGVNLIERVFEKKFVAHEVELNPKSEAEVQAELAQQEQVEWDEALPNLIRMASEGQFAELHQWMSVLLANNRYAKWDSELLRKLIQSYTKQQQWAEANRYLHIFKTDFPDQMTVPLRLSWTHVLLELGRPRSAIRILKSLEGVAIQRDQKSIVTKLAERALEQVKAGILEPGDDS
ncbi:MAG: rhomboid family intramembrane serine protease [Planctomycetaceae bacterium]|nr:rhomboid family intramembrane serine protease [Planctomycetaceae bacterium]